MLSKRSIRVVAITGVALCVIFGPDASFEGEGRTRELTKTEDEPVMQQHRRLGLTCGPGEKLYEPDWNSVVIDPLLDEQTVDMYDADDRRRLHEMSEEERMLKKKTITLKKSKNGNCGKADLSQAADGTLIMEAETEPDPEDVIDVLSPTEPAFPKNFASLEVIFEDTNVTDVAIAIGGLDSDGKRGKCGRVKFFDDNDDELEIEYEPSPGLTFKDNYAFEKTKNKADPTKKLSCKAKDLENRDSNGKRRLCRKMKFDQSSFIFDPVDVATPQTFSAAPGIDFAYCGADPNYVAPAPGSPVPGVNGDPLIMGLKGQLFKFNGRNGGWYSAISTAMFQWNMRISQFENCPEKSDTFTTGVAFTFFDTAKQATRKIEISVVDELNVDVGCDPSLPNCLGAGSLEMIIDGKKHLSPGYYHLDDIGAHRVLAFNTFYECSRKWYDFDIAPVETPLTSKVRSARRLEQVPGAFETIDSIKGTVVNQEDCEKWLTERKKFGDLFAQPGHYSTILVKTDEVSFHVEYKQENERCNAHSLNVWMSSVSPGLLMQPWEGIIGETKEETKGDTYDRLNVLKYAKDEDYEVESSFSTKCMGCHAGQK